MDERHDWAAATARLNLRCYVRPLEVVSIGSGLVFNFLGRCPRQRWNWAAGPMSIASAGCELTHAG
jgi:hypothetical protein